MNNLNKHPRYSNRVHALLAIACATIVQTRAEETKDSPSWFKDKLPAFLTEGKVNVNSNLRYEYADIDSFGGGPDPAESNALTLRTRLGYTTGNLSGFKSMLEFENVTSLIDEDNYNPAGLNPNSATKSVIADPEATEVNRAWLSYEKMDTTVKFGRQRIVLDNARFVGNVIWRQNEQTFDAVSLKNTSLIPKTELFYAYLFRIHRIFGDDHPAGNWDSDSHIFHVAYDLGKPGKLTGYGYLLDLPDALALSSSTFGASLDGKYTINDAWAASYKAEFAMQSDYGDNPIDYSAPYYHLNAGGFYKKFNFGLGYEVLASDNGTIGFSTPLATAHAFNGWADAFLATPADGLEDMYAWIGYSLPGGVPLKILYHDFSAEDGGNDYGNEVNILATKKLGKYFSLLAKAAVYQDGDNGRAGRTRYWLQAAFNF
jgi:outer membrane biogenesis lipoprotein LolB